MRKEINVGALHRKVRDERLRWRAIFQEENSNVFQSGSTSAYQKEKRGRPKRESDDYLKHNMQILGLEEDDTQGQGL